MLKLMEVFPKSLLHSTIHILPKCTHSTNLVQKNLKRKKKFIFPLPILYFLLSNFTIYIKMQTPSLPYWWNWCTGTEKIITSWRDDVKYCVQKSQKQNKLKKKQKPLLLLLLTWIKCLAIRDSFNSMNLNISCCSK